VPEAGDAEGRGPTVYSIAAHRGFADALVAGLIPRYSEPELGLARLTLLVPSQRAARTITEAFVRAGGSGRGLGGGLLLPRMVVAGDLDLDEALGAALDPLGAGADIPPAVEPMRRWLRLAALIVAEEGEDAPKGAALLARAFETARTIDRLAVEGIAPQDLLSEDVLTLVGEQAEHWRASTRRFLRLDALWRAELAGRGEVDPPTRRNLLFARAADSWKANPPPHPIVAAGVTSASPALARLLRVVSELPQGAVILPDLDLSLDDDVWDALGTAGVPDEAGGEAFGRSDALTHPQYHLKLLLNRMGVARAEVRNWHRSGPSAAPSARSMAISNLFLPPAASARWVDLPEPRRRLSAVRLMETAHPGEEAQAIAILMREALETPEKRVALVTPNRGLAARVVAHLERWGIKADDTAGRPLPQTAAGRVILLLAEVLGEGAPPVPLVALLGHPLVRAGEGRPAWLEHVRRFDRMLRGPRPAAGLEPLRAMVGARADRRGRQAYAAWWAEAETMLAPLMTFAEDAPLSDLLHALAVAGEALCGEALWQNADGRALSALLSEFTDAAREAGTRLPPRDLAAALRGSMERVAVRPPWGGHPRVAIYGLLEARMARADLIICGGLVEGVWPGSPSPDPLLPPAVLRHLGVPAAEFRIGLAAHDLAGALGAPQVVLSWARRDEGGPVIASRFVLRVRAMLGAKLAGEHAETDAVALAHAIDAGHKADAYPRPAPMPSAEQRRVGFSVTALDRLRSDPYQFYASEIMGLRRLEALDAEPSAALKGTAAHAILDAWHKGGELPGALIPIAHAELDKLSAHPLMRSLWRPRLVKALEWVAGEILRQRIEDGRIVLGTELDGVMDFAGLRIHGRIDRIDRLADGSLAVVDYKTGGPPKAARVAAGYTLQLGTLGLIARDGEFKGEDKRPVSGEATKFEYWSLAKKGDDFGYINEPIPDGKRKTKGIPREEFLPVTEGFLKDAVERWIIGDEAFTARLVPDLDVYNDYDQLMRLDEWFGLLGDAA